MSVENSSLREIAYHIDNAKVYLTSNQFFNVALLLKWIYFRKSKQQILEKYAQVDQLIMLWSCDRKISSENCLIN